MVGKKGGGDVAPGLSSGFCFAGEVWPGLMDKDEGVGYHTFLKNPQGAALESDVILFLMGKQSLRIIPNQSDFGTSVWGHLVVTIGWQLWASSG